MKRPLPLSSRAVSCIVRLFLLTVASGLICANATLINFSALSQAARIHLADQLNGAGNGLAVWQASSPNLPGPVCWNSCAPDFQPNRLYQRQECFVHPGNRQWRHGLSVRQSGDMSWTLHQRAFTRTEAAPHASAWWFSNPSLCLRPRLAMAPYEDEQSSTGKSASLSCSSLGPPCGKDYIVARSDAAIAYRKVGADERRRAN
jgi:hypothetical protein